jgi:plastocyanin
MRRTLLCALALGLLAAPPAAAAPVEGTVTIDGAPAAGAVVYLEGAREAPRPAQPPAVVIDQRNLNFAPRVLPVVRGTVVQFHNSDDVLHNVFSPSAAAGKFNLGTYGRGQERAVTMNEPGEVLVLCNIHMEMEARVLVLRDPYFATAGPDGRYRIADVPPGSYRARVWRDRWRSDERTVEVAAASEGAGAVVVDLRVGR